MACFSFFTACDTLEDETDKPSNTEQDSNQGDNGNGGNKGGSEVSDEDLQFEFTASFFDRLWYEIEPDSLLFRYGKTICGRINRGKGITAFSVDNIEGEVLVTQTIDIEKYDDALSAMSARHKKEKPDDWKQSGEYLYCRYVIDYSDPNTKYTSAEEMLVIVALMVSMNNEPDYEETPVEETVDTPNSDGYGDDEYYKYREDYNDYPKSDEDDENGVG